MANHPHNAKRPESRAVLAALEADDMTALGLALSPRQRAFAHEYIVDFNATAAAVRAGYAIANAAQQAHLLMKNKGVARYIDDLSQSKEAKIITVSPEYVIQKVTEIVTKENAKDGDKLRGLELLARHLGMFVDRTEISGPDGGAIELENRKVKEEAESFTSLIKAIGDRNKGNLTVVK